MKATVTWAKSGFVGAIGVGSAQVSSTLSEGMNAVGESVTLVVVSGATAAASDAVVQGGNIATGLLLILNSV